MNTLFTINTTLIAELILFSLVIIVIGRYVLPPLRRAMAARQTEMDAGLAAAAAGHRLLAQAEIDYTQRLDEARQKGSTIYNNYRRMAEMTQAEARKRAKLTTEQTGVGAAGRRRAS